MSRQEEKDRWLPAEEERDSPSVLFSHWQWKTLLHDRGSELLSGAVLSS